MPPPTPPICRRTPDKLHRGDVVQLIPGAAPEVIRSTRFVNGRWMIRTLTNLHRMPAELLVPVVAEFVDGVGFVTAEAVA